MSKRASVPARVIAVTALVCGLAVLLLVIATSFDGGGGGSGKRVPKGQVMRDKHAKGSFKGAYVVQNGDTLTSIAHETGVPVSQILRLNPGVDPQILISGERLKLR